MEIKPYKKHQRVRIRPIFLFEDPVFPSIEDFEAYDRIAQHIRSITNVPQ